MDLYLVCNTQNAMFGVLGIGYEAFNFLTPKGLRAHEAWENLQCCDHVLKCYIWSEKPQVCYMFILYSMDVLIVQVKNDVDYINYNSASIP